MIVTDIIGNMYVVPSIPRALADFLFQRIAKDHVHEFLDVWKTISKQDKLRLEKTIRAVCAIDPLNFAATNHSSP